MSSRIVNRSLTKIVKINVTGNQTNGYWFRDGFIVPNNTSKDQRADNIKWMKKNN